MATAVERLDRTCGAGRERGRANTLHGRGSPAETQGRPAAGGDTDHRGRPTAAGDGADTLRSGGERTESTGTDASSDEDCSQTPDGTTEADWKMAPSLADKEGFRAAMQTGSAGHEGLVRAKRYFREECNRWLDSVEAQKEERGNALADVLCQGLTFGVIEPGRRGDTIRRIRDAERPWNPIEPERSREEPRCRSLAAAVPGMAQRGRAQTSVAIP